MAKPIVFTRGAGHAEATVSVKDKARISPATVAAELDAMFPTPGKRWFQYDNKPACVQRMSSGSLQVMGPLDRLVQISQGVITNEHVLQGDVVSFLTAAKNAQ